MKTLTVKVRIADLWALLDCAQRGAEDRIEYATEHPSEYTPAEIWVIHRDRQRIERVTRALQKAAGILP